MIEIIFAGNLDACRTELQIADESGSMVAIVYEDSDGWHSETAGSQLEPSSSFHTVIENAQEVLSHYMNRRGDNAPSELTAGALALRLMVKDGGTVMGRNGQTF
jgi:hypothetical protein